MTSPLRHTKHEIENAAKAARELGLRVILRPDGSMEFIPVDHNRQKTAVDEMEEFSLC